MIGHAEVRAVDGVHAEVRRPEHPEPAVRADALAIAAAGHAAGTAFPDVARGGPPAPVAVTHLAEALPTTRAQAQDVALATVAHHVAAVPASPARTGDLLPERVRAGTSRLLGGTAARSSAVLAPRPARRPGPRTAAAVMTQRRTRLPWSQIPQERLLVAWTRVVREHALPADELRLIGVFGPAPLGAVDGVALDPDGERALLSLHRTRVPGPTGDVALARHLPTGRLLSAVVEREAAVPRTRRRGDGRGVR